MATRVATGSATETDSTTCGRKAAEAAYSGLGGSGNVNLAIVFASTKYVYKEMLQGIHQVIGNAPLIGCSTAGEFCNDTVFDQSVVVMLVQSDTIRIKTSVGKNLKGHCSDSIESLFSHFGTPSREQAEAFPHKSILLLSDGLAGAGELLVISAALKAGRHATIAGGAAGDGGVFKQTYVFHGREVHSDSVVGAELWSVSPTGIGVAHGWCPSKFSGQVTKSKGNLLSEINGKPAFQLYRDFAAAIHYKLTAQNSDAFMMNNELGIQLSAGEGKVRAPLKLNPDGSILMAAEVPQAVTVSIVEGKQDSLLAAAKSAAEQALARLGGAKPAGAIVFDCIARKICLNTDFSQEISVLRKILGPIPVIGFNTYGEIARVPGNVSGFHNTTDVVFILPE